MKTYQLTRHGASELPLSAASLDEASRQLPQGLYTTFRTYASGAKVIGLQNHLNRLYLPAAAENIRPQVSQGELRRFLAQACSAMQAESRLRLTLSVSDQAGAIFVSLEPFTPLRLETYNRGVGVISAQAVRHSPRLKSTAFIQSSADLRRLATGNDIFEVLLCQKRNILEGLTSNFYAIQSERLLTSRNGILLGVTRRAVLRLARGEGLKIEYRPPSLDESFTESFLSSSSRGIVPVVALDGKPVGEGRVGAWTKTLMSAYDEYAQQKAEEIYRPP